MSKTHNVIDLNATGRMSRSSRKDILEHCRKLAERHVVAIGKHVLDNVDDTLFEYSNKADNNSDQGAYLDAMRIIRLKRESFEKDLLQRFIANHTGAFAATQAGGASKPQAATLELDQFSLVADDELEEQIAINKLIEKARSRFDDALKAIAHRYNEIVPKASFSGENSPLDPTTICTAFRDAAANLGVEIKIKIVLFKLLDRYMMENLGDMYDEVNQYFVAQNVLPNYKYKLSKTIVSSSPDTARARLPDANLPEGANQGDGTSADGNTFQMMSNLLGTQGFPVGGYFPAPALPGMGGGMPAGAPVYVTTDVVHGFTQLQHEALNNPALHKPQQILTTLIGTIGSQRGDGTSGNINKQDADTLTLVGMMFDIIFDDPKMSDRLKAILARMQIPLFKVAILDKTFFNKKTHPARTLLNTLSQSGVLVSDMGEAGEELLFGKINAVVEHILNEFDEDIGIFTAALEDFNQFIATEQHRVRETEDTRLKTAEARERFEKARIKAADELEKLANARELPASVMLWLSEAWQTFLASILVKDGEESTRYRMALDITDELLWTLEPKRGSADRQRMAKKIPGLLATIRQALEDIAWDKAKIATLFKTLEAHHIAVLRGDTPPSHANLGGETDVEMKLPSAKTTATVEPVADDFDKVLDEYDLNEEVVLASGNADEFEPGSEIDDEYMQTVRDMQVGEWIELTDQNNRVTRCKLEWKGDVVDQYFFANWRYQIVAERTLGQLAEELRTGKARLIDDLPMVDKALSSIMDRLMNNKKSAPHDNA
ncbi:MAG: DUF1631 domain-containing protein [Pseudomonadota bacterium]